MSKPLFADLSDNEQREELDILFPKKRTVVSHARCNGGDSDCPVCAGFVDEPEDKHCDTVN